MMFVLVLFVVLFEFIVVGEECQWGFLVVFGSVI